MLCGCVTEEVMNVASKLLLISDLAIKTLCVYGSCFWQLQLPPVVFVVITVMLLVPCQLRCCLARIELVHCLTMFLSIYSCLQCFDAVGWDAGVVICLEWRADLHISQLIPLPPTVSCFSKIQIGFTFLVLAHPGNVCLCVQHTDEPCKLAEPIEMPFGADLCWLKNALSNEVHLGTNWRIWLNDPCAAEMQSYIRLLWPLVL